MIMEANADETDDDIKNLNALLAETNNDDDDIHFVSLEEIQRRTAEKRRLERKRRLQQLAAVHNDSSAADHNNDNDDDVMKYENKKNENDTLLIVEQRHDNILPTPSTFNHDVNITRNSASNGTEELIKINKDNFQKEKNLTNANDDDNNDDDSDEYDMFAIKSASPTVLEGDMKKQNKMGIHTINTSTDAQQQQQQDWDDAEGYYKAVIGETIYLPLATETKGNEFSNQRNVNKNVSNPGNANYDNDDNSCSFRITGLIGKGVFSTVLKGTTSHNSSSIGLPPIVAIKLIRHNETMAKGALNELRVLHKLKGSPGIVPLLLPSTENSNGKTPNDNNKLVAGTSNSTANLIEYRGHVVFVFQYMEYNLRDVLQKFGKNVGLSLQAVRSYFGQLLAAAMHLQKHSIIHSDIKPDNILVSSDFGIVQIADFGSAMEVGYNSSELQLPTPYLVSRFYRAPEIILGIVPTTYAIDLWSLAVTVCELFLGDVVFKGKSNNDMLFVMQQHLGPVPNRVIRQHIVQCQKYTTNNVPAHFQHQSTSNNNNNSGGGGAAYYNFIQRTVDAVTGTPIHKVLPLSTHHGSTTYDNNNSTNNNTTSSTRFPLGTPLQQKLLKAKSAKDSRHMVQQFSDLVHKCLSFDPMKRIPLKDALRHDFFSSAIATTTTTTNKS